MKTLLVIALLTVAQAPQKVTLVLKNNGILPRHFKFLEKQPGTPVNVFTTYLLPGQTYKVALTVGTSLAQVNQREIYAAMRGLDVTGKPLLVVKADDDRKTVKLVQ